MACTTATEAALPPPPPPPPTAEVALVDALRPGVVALRVVALTLSHHLRQVVTYEGRDGGQYHHRLVLPWFFFHRLAHEVAGQLHQAHVSMEEAHTAVGLLLNHPDALRHLLGDHAVAHLALPPPPDAAIMAHLTRSTHYVDSQWQWRTTSTSSDTSPVVASPSVASPAPPQVSKRPRRTAKGAAAAASADPAVVAPPSSPPAAVAPAPPALEDRLEALVRTQAERVATFVVDQVHSSFRTLPDLRDAFDLIKRRLVEHTARGRGGGSEEEGVDVVVRLLFSGHTCHIARQATLATGVVHDLVQVLAKSLLAGRMASLFPEAVIPVSGIPLPVVVGDEATVGASRRAMARATLQQLHQAHRDQLAALNGRLERLLEVAAQRGDYSTAVMVDALDHLLEPARAVEANTRVWRMLAAAVYGDEHEDVGAALVEPPPTPTPLSRATLTYMTTLQATNENLRRQLQATKEELQRLRGGQSGP